MPKTASIFRHGAHDVNRVNQRLEHVYRYTSQMLQRYQNNIATESRNHTSAIPRMSPNFEKAGRRHYAGTTAAWIVAQQTLGAAAKRSDKELFEQQRTKTGFIPMQELPDETRSKIAQEVETLRLRQIEASKAKRDGHQQSTTLNDRMDVPQMTIWSEVLDRPSGTEYGDSDCGNDADNSAQGSFGGSSDDCSDSRSDNDSDGGSDD
jgi:hypothetical protein